MDSIERSLEKARGLQFRSQWAARFGEAIDDQPPAGFSLLPHSLPHLQRWNRQALPDKLARRVALLHRHALLAVIAADPEAVALEQRLVAARPGMDPSDLRRLVAARERGARDLGYESYCDLWLAALGSDRGEVEQWIDHLERSTRDAAHQLARNCSGRGIPLSHTLASNRAERPLKLLDQCLGAEGHLQRGLSTLDEFGLPLRLDRVTFRDWSGPQSQARFLAHPVSIPGDIRLMLGRRSGHPGQRGLLHELGHAAYYTAAIQPHYPLRLPANRVVSEGFAEFFERLT